MSHQPVVPVAAARGQNRHRERAGPKSVTLVHVKILH